MLFADLGFAKNKVDVNVSMLGTANFMAPEIYKGQRQNQGVDIWALGCSLYTMYTHQYLFIGNID